MIVTGWVGDGCEIVGVGKGGWVDELSMDCCIGCCCCCCCCGGLRSS